MTIPNDFNPGTAPSPASCPFCRSPSVSTTSKIISAATYWRCATCGQIWNPARLLARPARSNRW